MKETILGNHLRKVPSIAVGCMRLSEKSKDEMNHFIHSALEQGAYFFDHADIYGGGMSETVFGEAFSGDPSLKREDIFLQSKCGIRQGFYDLSKDHILESVDGILKRLQTDHIDIYQMHHIERHAPWAEIWPAFERLANQGKILYTGSCNFAARHLVTAQYEAEKRNFLGLVSEQDKYNLVNRLPELEVLPAAKELGIAFLPWSPLHGGYLSGTMMNRHAGSRGAEEFATHLSEAQKQQLLQYESLCTDIGESQADVALAWLLRNPGVTAPIIGPRTDRQLESALHAAEIKLSDDVLKNWIASFPDQEERPRKLTPGK